MNKNFAAASSMTVGGFSASHHSTFRGTVPHICVIGAGIAGLRCSDVLIQHGFKVTILEARNRIGGRLCQEKVGGRLIDVGPNWIHGTDNNPILNIAKEVGTKIHSWDGRQAVFDGFGKAIPHEIATKCNEVLWSMISDAFNYSSEKSNSVPANMSLLDFFKERVASSVASFEDDPDKLVMMEKTVLEMAQIWGAFVGTSVARQSLRFFWLEKSLDGEDVFVADTYKKILDRIAQPAIAKAFLKLENEATSTHTVQSDSAIKVRVEILNHSAEDFDGVVVTATLGWLKRNKSIFHPPLTEELQSSIDAISYGQLDKFYITFPEAWWHSDSRSVSGNLIANNTATKRTGSHVVFQNVQEELTFPGFIYWTNPQLIKGEPATTTQTGINMAALPNGCGHPTLLFYTYGETSTLLARRVGAANTSQMRKSIIVSYFRPFYAQLPNYNNSDSTCSPIATFATCWSNDKMAGFGAYSNFQVGLENGDRDIERMREGMPQRKIWFAGEHTAPFIATGTVTGAYWSGENVARRIVQSFELS